MQIIKQVLKISGGNATLSDSKNQNVYSSIQMKVGLSAYFEFDIRLDEFDENGDLKPYPFEELSGADCFYFVLDGDYNQNTDPKMLRTSGITLTQSTDDPPRTIFRAQVPNTALPELMSYISTNSSATLRGEICGYSSNGSPRNALFAWDFEVVVKNRIYLGGSSEAIETDPEYLTAAQVRALIAQATQSTTPGPDGESAYQVAVSNGFEGTENEWLDSIVGNPGADGKSSYELAQENGYEGTVTEWLASLKGAAGENGKGLHYDKSSTDIADRALYDSESAGFVFALQVTDSVNKKTSIHFYTKNSDAAADWDDPLVITFFSSGTSSASTIVSIAPIEFEAPTELNTCMQFSLASYPLATVAAVVIDTADGEETLPYRSDLGIRKIVKGSNKTVKVYFGANVPSFQTGRVYLTQMIAANGTGSGITADPTGTMYYGYIPYLVAGNVYRVHEITSAMIAASSATVTTEDVSVLGKTSLGTIPPGSLAFVMVPKAANLSAVKYDGLSGYVPFELNNGASGTGANGTEVTIDGVVFRVYGEFKLEPESELFFKIEEL